MRKGIAAALITGSLLTGGAVGTALLGPSVASAQSSTSSDTQSSQSGTPPADPGGHHRGGPGAHADPSVAANAIGISVDDLKTALDSGQSLADVAKANNVDPQVVIDALVADAQSHIAADVTSGRLTQDQADKINADLVQHITDHVNHAGGPGGAGCDGMDHDGSPPADQGSSSSSNSTDS